jgi:CysZ protein
MERHFDRKNSRIFIKSNRGLAIGNGAVFIFLILIPILGAFIAPTLATISGTLSALERIEK